MNAPKKLIALFLFLSLIPPNVDETAFVLTESLTQFLLVVGFVFLILWMSQRKLGLLLISSIAIALSALVRPTYQLLFVVISGLLFLSILFYRTYRRQLLRSSLIIFIVSTLILGGFAYYNYLNFDYFGLTYRFGFHLSTKTARVIEKLPDEYSEVREVLIRHRNRTLLKPNSSHTGENYIYQAIPDLEKATGLRGKDLGNYMVKLNMILIQSEPRYYLIDVARSMAVFWLPSNSEISNFQSKMIELFWSILHFVTIAILLVLLLALIGFGVLLLNLQGKVKTFLVELLSSGDLFLICQSLCISLVIIVYTMFISTMFDVGTPRQRAPTDLLIFFTISLGIYFWKQMRNNLSKIGS